MSDELLPCPFCGGKAALYPDEPEDPETPWLVYCVACGNGTDYEEKQYAIRLWNRRAVAASLAAHAQAVDALRELLSIADLAKHSAEDHLQYIDLCAVCQARSALAQIEAGKEKQRWLTNWAG